MKIAVFLSSVIIAVSRRLQVRTGIGIFTTSIILKFKLNYGLNFIFSLQEVRAKHEPQHCPNWRYYNHRVLAELPNRRQSIGKGPRQGL